MASLQRRIGCGLLSRLLLPVLLLALLFPGYGQEPSYLISESELQSIENELTKQRAELVGLRKSLNQSALSTSALRQSLNEAENELLKQEKQLDELSSRLEQASAISTTLRTRLEIAQSEVERLRDLLTQLRESFEAFETEALQRIRRARMGTVLAAIAGAVAGFFVGAATN